MNEGFSNPFFKSPLLIFGVSLGIAAAVLIFLYSKKVVGGRLRKSFTFLSLAAFLFATGVLAVTLLPLIFSENTANLLHDLSLTVGFSLLIVSAYNFKHESAKAEYIISRDKAKSDFISVVAHHFRTPLSIIQWQTEELYATNMATPEKLKESILIVRENTEYLSQALDDIFLALAIENNEAQLTLKSILLREIVQKLIENLQQKIKKHNISLFFDKQNVPLVEVSVDETKVSYIVRVLLLNAIYYSQPGGNINVAIKRIDSGKGGQIVCDVMDNGIGIPKGEVSSIFKKFFRGKEASQKVTRGLGLGLYIAKTFAKMHGGDITFFSEENKGSTFSLYLPIEAHEKQHATPEKISG